MIESSDDRLAGVFDVAEIDYPTGLRVDGSC